MDGGLMTNAACLDWNAALLPVSSHVVELGGISLASHQPLMRFIAATVSGVLSPTLPSLVTRAPPSFQIMFCALPAPSGVRPSVNPRAYRLGGLLIFLQTSVSSSNVLGIVRLPVACS